MLNHYVIMTRIPQNKSVAVTSRAFSKNPKLRAEVLERYPNTKFNDTGRVFSRSELVEFLNDYSQAIVSLEPIDEEVLSQLPKLKIIAKYGVGLDNLDFDALEKRGILLGWQGGVNKRSVSELALMFMILALRRASEGNLDIRNGKWQPLVGGLLSGRTVGIIGCGHIGKDLISLLQPLGCKILPHDIRDLSEFYKKFNLKAATLDEVVKNSDVVSLHVPLTAATNFIFNEQRIFALKKGAILINTARGNLVDEQALKKALKERHLSAAAFDVFGNEPPLDSELLQLSNFFSTPHIGGSAEEAILAMGRSAMAGLESPRHPREILNEILPPV